MENILKYEKLVSKIASNYSNYSNYEDLRQVGMVGLMKALEKYVPSSDTKFSSYAFLWIKGEILDYLRCDRSVKVSKDIIKMCKQINKCQEYLRNKLNKEPSIKEIALFLECDESDVENALLSKELVLSTDFYVNEDENLNLYNAIPYNEKMYDAEIMDLYNALDNLTEEEKEIINMRYFKDMTQTEVSKKLGTNQVNISRKEEKILVKLNKSLVA